MTDFCWTPDAVEQLKRLWADGHSCSQIARGLGGGLTRSAVIGKVHRLKLPARAARGITKVLRAYPALRKPAVKLADRMKVVGCGPHPDAVRLADGSRIGTADLRDCHCRWPHGDVGASGFHYCGQPRVAGSSWCAAHKARSCAKAQVVAPEAAQLGRQAEQQFARMWG